MGGSAKRWLWRRACARGSTHWAASFIRTKRPPAATRNNLIAINHWLLATADAQVPEIAREERSLQIFNDEKKLAQISSGPLFASGRVTLAQLACTEPHGAVNSARLARRGPVLVVENKATFDSAWRALASRPKPAYAAVVLGSGHAVSSIAPDLAIIGKMQQIRATRFDYAGDIDVDGVLAAYAFLRAAREAGLQAKMATELWSALAHAEPTRPDPSAGDLTTPAAVRAGAECELPLAVIARLEARVRIPHERIDRIALTDTAWWTPR